jgi:GntR family transcriptional regulator
MTMADPEKKGGGRRKQPSDVALAGSRVLDRGTFVPLYFQLAEVLKQLLETGAWQPGARFPSESEIAKQFDVSRTVIRPALDLLVGDGSIVRIKGSGTFVAPPKRDVPVTGLVRALLDWPDDLTIKILTAHKSSPNRTVSRFLGVERQRASVSHVTAVIHADERPVCLIDSYTVATLVPWLLPTVQALQTGVEPPARGHLDLTRATVSIEGAFFGQWGASQVGVSAGDPTLMGRLIQFGKAKGAKHEQKIEFARLIYRSDSTQLTIESG